MSYVTEKIMGKMPLYGFFGVLLVILSFLSWFISVPKPLGLLVVNVVFMVGYSLLLDSGIYLLQGHSLLHHPKRHIQILTHVLLLTLVGGVLFDIYGLWIAKIWVYPEVSTSLLLFYWPFWGLVGLIVYLNYILFKIILRRQLGYRKKKEIVRSREKLLFNFFGLVGASGLSAGTVILLLRWQTPVPIWLLFSIGISAWFLFEFIEYERHETSLIKDILQGDWIPILAILGGSAVTSLIWEILNLPLQNWQYINWPYPNLNIADIPLMVFLTWPFIYILFLSFYRAVYKKETKTLW